MNQENTGRTSIYWKSVLNKDINLKVMLNALPTKGNLVYEYNPFRNYRLTENKYYYKEGYYSEKELKSEFGIELKQYIIYDNVLHWSDDLEKYYKYDETQTGESGTEYSESELLNLKIVQKNNIWYNNGNKLTYPPTFIRYEYNGESILSSSKEIFGFRDPLKNLITDIELFEKGQLIDFITDEFNFSLEHPVNIIPQYSYDGSVNLILNDGYNPPRLINSRFSATGRNTYEIVDRKGNNDTNIYDQGEQFEIDTSLYKIVNGIPKVEFLGTRSGGAMKIGNYHFYFKLCDADDNETDFVAESGLVSIFIGENTFSSVHTGTKNENSTKQVEFKLSNVDSAYDYITVYYSRYTAEAGDNFVTQYAKINKKYLRTANKLVITGFEEITEITSADINLQYNLVDAAWTSAVCQNMLFMANVHKQDIPYEELQDLSLRILPCLKHEPYEAEIDHKYNVNNVKNSYINSKFIYDKTGYWDNELYRFGVVYILPNGELTPVFNIRGGIGIGKTVGFSKIPVFNDNNERQQVKYNESTNFLAETVDEYYNNEYPENSNFTEFVQYENVKGVCSFKTVHNFEQDIIYSVNFYADEDTKKELSKYVKGYFFVRQTRMPLKLAQGVTIGIDNVARTPTIPTAGGMLTTLQNVLEKTHVQTDDINGINYISEGFLKRYSFTSKRKGSSIWGKIGKIAGIAAAVVGTAACLIAPGAQIFATLGLKAIITSVTAFIGTTATSALLGIAGTAAGAIVGTVVSGVTAGLQELGQVIINHGQKTKMNGKATKPAPGHKLVETEDSRKLTKNYEDRIIIKDPDHNKVQGIICPDYTVNPAYFNQIFVGNKHLIKTDERQSAVVEERSGNTYFTNEGRHFYLEAYSKANSVQRAECKIMAVPDNVKCTGIDNVLFRSRAGEAEEAWRYEFIGEEIIDDSDDKKINADIVRGVYSPYLAFLNTTIGPAQIVNIYIPGYTENNMSEYVDIRMHDNSPFFAITDRKSIKSETSGTIVGDKNNKDILLENAYRGDCYICQFTQRVFRNFNDPSAPYNDDFVDVNTWRDNYDPNDQSKYSQINSGDVNAVPLGMWVTFKVRSSNNLNIRTLDGSNVTDTAMVGHPKGYFPVHPMSVEGVYKHAESNIYNKGFTKSVGERWNFEAPDVPHIKNWFGTRIMYSDIHVNDAFKNGFRIFKGQNYRDYTREYGEIVKLISLESNLLCVFEHGIALIPVNERAVAGQGAGGNVYINTSNVLPENPKIISDMFGSQWAESVIKVPGRTGDARQYVYGVDTVAKKIWRTDGNVLECISDHKVQEFLNNNITLGERELTPKIGIRNVKTHYNANKRDVMFTFYDNTYGFEEKVWNLCWNELLQKFVTFYSWVPSYMENINNIPFSFNRDTSKWIAKLGQSHTESSFADGITLSNVILNDKEDFDNGSVVDNFMVKIPYTTKSGEIKYLEKEIKNKKKFIGALSLSNRVLPDQSAFYNITYSLEKDLYGNYKSFEIKELEFDESTDGIKIPDDGKFSGEKIHVYGLYFKDGKDEYQPIYYRVPEDVNLQGEFFEVLDSSGNTIYNYEKLYTPESLYSELYYRNSAGHSYPDYDIHKLGTEGLETTFIPINLAEKFTEDDKELLCEYLGLDYNIVSDESHSEYQSVNEQLNYYIGKSKSWVQNGKMLSLFEKMYPAETIIGNTSSIYNGDNPPINAYPCTSIGEIRNIARTSIEEDKGDAIVHGIRLDQHWVLQQAKEKSKRKVWYELPIFKDITGKRLMLPKEDQVNSNNLVTLLNIKANIVIEEKSNTLLSNDYYNMKASYASGTNLINAGQYESVVAIAPDWNLQFLSTDFWKHGQSGLIDMTDGIFPTYWYGKQHPFEFECVVVNDPSVHKIFRNLELVSNNVKPESFHYEIIGDSYDFAKDKVNMYFRQEAKRALWQYNGADICYDRNFLKVQTRQQSKSADLPHTYYSRKDTINEIEDSYIALTGIKNYDYRHLSGSEILYYPTRKEFRIWNHAQAISLDDLSKDDARSLITANCQYLEDRWRVTINPILVCYKNEYNKNYSGTTFQDNNSTWIKEGTKPLFPPLTIMNSPIPNDAKNQIIQSQNGEIEIPEELFNLGYSGTQGIDSQNWLNEVGIYGTNFGLAQNRKELDMKDKFIKIRIRYTGDQLAIIDFLNTIYSISYS